MQACPAMTTPVTDIAMSPRPGTGEGQSWTPTHCPYCAFQCGMDVGDATPGADSRIRPRDFPVNNGALCIKGWTAAEALDHPDRLLGPLGRDASGQLVPVSWETALTRLTSAILHTQKTRGRDAVGVLGGGSLTNEKAYLLGKFARIGLGTASIDYNGRFCMSSAAAASISAFGVDRGLPFPVADIAGADVVLLAGSNAAVTMPPIMQYFEAQRARGGQFIVVDPRRTPTAAASTLHLQNVPGTDAAVANGLLHLLIRNHAIDRAYIESRTEGFGEARAAAAACWPEQVERATGVAEASLGEAAALLAAAKTVMVLTGRGVEQQSQGVANVQAFINIALALGQVGRPFGGYGCLTGQGNGQGGREHGQKADQLPGYRKIDDPAARAHLARVWDVPEPSIPGPGRSAWEMLDTAGQDGGVRTLLVIGTNPCVSAPDLTRVEARLRSLDFLAVADFFLSETAVIADLVLPATQWAEEDGTMTNLEGRVIFRQRAVEPPPGVLTDIELISELARRLGRGRHFAFPDTEAVFEELARASSGGVADYAGITYEKIRANDGVFWPCPSQRHAGTPRLFGTQAVDGDRFLPPPGFFTPNGRARFHAVRHRPPAEVPDPGFPLYFTTGRTLAQYQSGTQTRRLASLSRIEPEPALEMHPILALRLRLRDGEMVEVSTRRGSARFRLKVDVSIREDTVFAPFHWPAEGSANRLTNPALDPISRMPEFKIAAARVRRAESPHTQGGTHEQVHQEVRDEGKPEGSS